MSGHTEGPWAAPKIWAYRYICPADHANRPVGGAVDPEINRDRYMQIIAVVDEDKFDRGDRQANAHLIAAAPEMREALEDCDKAFVSWQVGQIPGRPEDILALIVKVRAALAKAEPHKADDHA